MATIAAGEGQEQRIYHDAKLDGGDRDEAAAAAARLGVGRRSDARRGCDGGREGERVADTHTGRPSSGESRGRENERETGGATQRA